MSSNNRRIAQPTGTERGRARSSKRDLRPTIFPFVSPEDWRDPESVLTTLFSRAQDRAFEISDWYLADKATKRRLSRLLRAAAIIFGSAGGLVPLLMLTVRGVEFATVGYVLLALSGTCVAFDRFFGLSSAWMRDILGSQAVHRRLDEFQHQWAETLLEEDSSTRPGVERRLHLLYSFLGSLHEIVQTETASWESEFRTSISQVREATTPVEQKSLNP